MSSNSKVQSRMKTRTITCHVIKETDFDQLVRKTYGIKDFSFVASRECGNDTQHVFEDVGYEPLDEWDTEAIENIKEEQDYCSINVIFNDLCIKGFIDAGNYIVEVCW